MRYDAEHEIFFLWNLAAGMVTNLLPGRDCYWIVLCYSVVLYLIAAWLTPLRPD